MNDLAADGTTKLKTEENECVIPHAHSHDDHKPHKPKKEHIVDIHDVSGHSHDVVSGVIDAEHGSESDISTLVLELGMCVQH